MSGHAGRGKKYLLLKHVRYSHHLRSPLHVNPIHFYLCMVALLAKMENREASAGDVSISSLGGLVRLGDCKRQINDLRPQSTQQTRQ